MGSTVDTYRNKRKDSIKTNPRIICDVMMSSAFTWLWKRPFAVLVKTMLNLAVRNLTNVWTTLITY
jgi:hypothetical protein